MNDNKQYLHIFNLSLYQLPNMFILLLYYINYETEYNYTIIISVK